MAWDPIDSSELNPGYPVLKHMRKAWNCLQYLFGQAGTLAGLNIQNGSFEINADSNNVPDTWTWSGFPGGTIAMDTTTPAHGAAGIAINHPGGSGNGGGELSSDYTPCSQLKQIFIQFIHWASVAAMHNVVYITWYTKDKLTISTVAIYDSVTNPVSPRLIVCGATPPANARFYKIRINGGLNDSSVAGVAYFDDVKEVEYFFGCSAPDFTVAEATYGFGSYGDAGSATITLPRKNIPVTMYFPAQLRVWTYGDSAFMRWRVGSAYSNEAVTTDTAYTSFDFTISFTPTAADTVLYMQLRRVDSPAIGKKISSAASLTVNPAAMAEI